MSPYVNPPICRPLCRMVALRDLIALVLDPQGRRSEAIPELAQAVSEMQQDQLDDYTKLIGIPGLDARELWLGTSRRGSI